MPNGDGVLVADTSGILAAMNANDAAHASVRDALEKEVGALIVPDLVIAEVDYLVLKILGRVAEEAFLADLASGAWRREPFTDADLARVRALIRTYRAHDIGVVDASIIATAERLDADRILTLDRRHFRTLHLRGKWAPTLLPDDR